MTTIADIMTRSIATVRRDETLQAAARRMQEMDVGSLPVLDGKAVAGIVTDRDIAVRGVAAGMIPQESLVADVMTAELRFCRADDTVEQAMYLFVIRQTDDVALRSDVLLLLAVPLPSVLLITLFCTEEPQP